MRFGLCTDQNLPFATFVDEGLRRTIASRRPAG
jgi:hypothetical protein